MQALGDGAVGRIYLIVHHGPRLGVGRVPGRAIGCREHGAPRTESARRPAHGIGFDVPSVMCLQFFWVRGGGGLGNLVESRT